MGETSRATDAAGIAPRDERRHDGDDAIVTDPGAAVEIAVRLAAASGFDRSSRADRARWLTALAEALEAHRDELVELAAEETHLSPARLTGEVTRTATQLRFFAGVALEGSYVEATLDAPDASLTPPRPDLRRMLRPLGVVAVFAASNPDPSGTKTSPGFVQYWPPSRVNEPARPAAMPATSATAAAAVTTTGLIEPSSP